MAGTVLISIRETTCSAAAAMPAKLYNPSDAYFARQKVNPYTHSCVTLGTACPTSMKRSHAWHCREGVLYLSTDLHSKKQQVANLMLNAKVVTVCAMATGFRKFNTVRSLNLMKLMTVQLFHLQIHVCND